MTFVIALALTLALTALVARRPRRRIRRAAKWLWAHPATVVLAVVFGYAWHRAGLNWALGISAGYTAVVVIGRFWWQHTAVDPLAPLFPMRRPAYRKQPIPRALRVQVFKRDKFLCVYCGDHRYLSADHIVPESKGGLATLENLQTLCRSCNSTKGAHGPVVVRSAQHPAPPEPTVQCGDGGHGGPFDVGRVFGDEIETVVCLNCDAEIPRDEVA